MGEGKRFIVQVDIHYRMGNGRPYYVYSLFDTETRRVVTDFDENPENVFREAKIRNGEWLPPEHAKDWLDNAESRTD